MVMSNNAKGSKENESFKQPQHTVHPVRGKPGAGKGGSNRPSTLRARPVNISRAPEDRAPSPPTPKLFRTGGEFPGRSYNLSEQSAEQISSLDDLKDSYVNIQPGDDCPCNYCKPHHLPHSQLFAQLMRYTSRVRDEPMAVLVARICLELRYPLAADVERKMNLFLMDTRDAFVLQEFIDCGWLFVNDLGYAEFTPRGLTIARQANMWLRDLTTDGIEPNPGPLMQSKLIEEIEALSKQPEGLWEPLTNRDHLSPGNKPRVKEVERLKEKRSWGQTKKIRSGVEFKSLSGLSAEQALAKPVGANKTSESIQPDTVDLHYVWKSAKINGLIEGNDRRNLDLAWGKFLLPKLFTVEEWDLDAIGELYSLTSYLAGKKIVHDGTEEISLPVSLVYELMGFLAHMDHDRSFNTFKVCVTKCRNLCRDLTLTPYEYYHVVTYAPVVAYLKCWRNQVHAAALVHSRFDRAEYDWWAAFKITLRPSRGKVTWAVGFAISTVFIMCCLMASSCWQALLLAIVLSFPTLFIAGLLHVAWIIMLFSALYLGNKAGLCFNLSWLKDQTELFVGDILASEGVASPLYDTFGPAQAPIIKSSHDPTAKVVKKSSGRKERAWDHVTNSVLTAVGAYAKGYVPTFFSPNAETEFSALEKRVLSEKLPGPDRERFISWVKDNVQSLVGKPVKVQPIPFEQWISNVNSGKSVKEKLRKTRAELDSIGVDLDYTCSPSQLKLWTTREAFSKMEAIGNRSPLTMNLKAARLIQGAKPEMTVLLGPWMSSLQGVIKKRWGLKNAVTFAPAVTSLEAGNKLDRNGVQWVEDDISSYDASIGSDLCELEVWLAQYFGAPKVVRDLMKANIKTHGYTSCGWYYSVEGTRKSGDTYTSLMNSLLNGLMHLYIYANSTGLHIEEVKKELSMLVSGDDNAMCYPAGVDIPWQEKMSDLGFSAKPIVRQDPHDMEFCSCRLWPTSLGWAFVPKLGKALLKIPFSLKVRPGLKPEAIARGTALSMYSVSLAIPPLKAYLDWILDKTQGVQAILPDDEPWKMSSAVVGEATDETWFYLKEQYGWDMSLQREWEAELKTFTLGKPSNSPLFMSLVDRDVAADRQLWPADSEFNNKRVKNWLFGRPVPVVERPEPLEDLTRYGVEPNPGPHTKKNGKKKQNKGKGNSRPKQARTVFIQPNIKGRGDYSIGQRLGSKAGGFLGDLAQKAFMTLTGMGDYSVTQNSLYSGSSKNCQPPSFGSSTRNGTTRIQHKEYVGDISTLGAIFNLVSYVINPTNATLFPWLSALAVNYEQYKIHGLVFFFNTNSATAVASTNTSLGAVIMSTQYNVNESAFTSKLQMEQYQYSVSTVPSASAMHPVECKPSLGTLDILYTVQDNSTEDARFTDFGRFSIATVGQQAASNIGELWAVYDIEFFKPRLFLNVMEVANPFFEALYIIQGASSTGALTDWNLAVTNQTPFTGTPTADYGVDNRPGWYRATSSTLPVSFDANYISFPGTLKGKYRVDITLEVNCADAPTEGIQWSMTKDWAVTSPDPFYAVYPWTGYGSKGFDPSRELPRNGVSTPPAHTRYFLTTEIFNTSFSFVVDLQGNVSGGGQRNIFIDFPGFNAVGNLKTIALGWGMINIAPFNVLLD